MCFSQFARLDVVQLRLRRSNQEKPNMARHLEPLASKIGEKCGLEIGGQVESQVLSSNVDLFLSQSGEATTKIRAA